MNIKQIILDLIGECDNKNNKLDLSKTKQHLVMAYHAIGEKKKPKLFVGDEKTPYQKWQEMIKKNVPKIEGLDKIEGLEQI